MRALLRKSEGRAPAAASAPGVREGLLAALLARVTTKRAYCDLFESPEAAESWSLAASLPPAQHELLLAMQVRKRARARAARRPAGEGAFLPPRAKKRRAAAARVC